MPNKVCPLSEYRRIVSALPRPSVEQVENFVQFVSNAHSWYKHLPLLPPGMPFFFFLDPYSGYDPVTHEERTETSPRFHYSWMTTREYRARFGHLSYATQAEIRFLLGSAETVREYAHLPKFSTEEGSFRLPPEVAAAGSVELTGVIHREACQPFAWMHVLPEEPARFPTKTPRQWPAETGGDPTLRKILEVIERMDEARRAEQIGDMLAVLLQPEKKRLQANMTQAIHRMLDLVYPPADP